MNRLLPCLWILGAVFASESESQSLFSAQDIFDLRGAGDPQFRPDSKALAYVRSSNDVLTDSTRKSIWLVDLESGDEQQLAADAYSPRWSADGTRMAFIAASTDKAPLLEVRSMTSGKTMTLATLKSPAGDITWSPDGRSIAVLMTELMPSEQLDAHLEKPSGASWAKPLIFTTLFKWQEDGAGEVPPRRSHLFVISSSGGTPQRVTTGEGNDEGPLSWSPNNQDILFTGRRGPNWQRQPFVSAIYRVSLANGSITPLSPNSGPYNQGTYSPDGKSIAYVGYDDQGRGYENQRLFLADSNGNAKRLLSGTLDRSVSHPQWSADGRFIFVQMDDHGVTKVVRFDRHGKIQVVASGLGGDEDNWDLPYTGGEFAISSQSKVAFTQGDVNHPPDIALASDGNITRVTRLNDATLGHRALAQITAQTVKSTFDGKELDAWVMRPPQFDPSIKYPLILEIHGGPYSSYGPFFSSDMQLYAAAGYMVVFVNSRGSTSYGEQFANEIEHTYPAHDADDLLSAIDALEQGGQVDPTREFVAGGSGGGVLAAWLIGKTHRFRAAAVQRPVINWTSETLTTDSYGWMARRWFGSMPWEDAVAFWHRSPLSLVGNVETPTLVVVGGADTRAPASEGIQLYNALQLRGIPAGLLVVPGASHSFSARPSQNAARVNSILGWFARFDQTQGGLTVDPR